MTDTHHVESPLAVTHRWRQWQATTCSQNTINQRSDVLERVVEHASAEAGRWVDPRELEMLGRIHRTTLTRWVADGRLPLAYKLPGRNGAMLFQRQDVIDLKAALDAAAANSDAGTVAVSA